MNVDDNDQLLRRRLEEEMLYVTKEDVNLTATMVVVAETIVMNFQFASNTLAIKARPGEDIVESNWLTVWMMLAVFFLNGIRLRTSNDTELVLLDHVFQFFLLLFSTNSVLAKIGDLLCDILHSIRIRRSES